MATKKVQTDIFDLSNYENEVDQEYKSYKVRLDADTVVTLRNPFLIPEENRARIFEIVSELNVGTEGEKTQETVINVGNAMIEMLTLVGDKNVGYLVDRIRGNLPVVKRIFEDYMETVQLGEASSSES